MTPKELEEVRRLVAVCDKVPLEGTTEAARFGQRLEKSLKKLLAHADLLAAGNELLQALVNDAAAEGPSAAMLTQAAAQEREACCKAVCHRCREGQGVAHDGNLRAWMHPGSGYGCQASQLRDRGPCRSPLPPGEAVARERAWFRQLLHDQGSLSRADFFDRYGCSDVWAALEARSIE